MAQYAFSRCYHSDDYPSMAAVLARVDAHFTTAQPQSEHRRWEYGVALTAIDRWLEDHGPTGEWLVDVGGGGSPFLHMLPVGVPSVVVDPGINQDLSAFVHACPRLAPVVTCLSVIEHVEDLDEFLYHLNCLVAPGGLLVLTTDIWDRGQPDTAHFHWMRTRIFTPRSLYDLDDDDSAAATLFRYGFGFACGCDPVYRGDQLYGPNGYSLASLVMSKR